MSAVIVINVQKITQQKSQFTHLLNLNESHRKDFISMSVFLWLRKQYKKLNVKREFFCVKIVNVQFVKGYINYRDHSIKEPQYRANTMQLTTRQLKHRSLCVII